MFSQISHGIRRLSSNATRWRWAAAEGPAEFSSWKPASGPETLCVARQGQRSAIHISVHRFPCIKYYITILYDRLVNKYQQVLLVTSSRITTFCQITIKPPLQMVSYTPPAHRWNISVRAMTAMPFLAGSWGKANDRAPINQPADMISNPSLLIVNIVQWSCLSTFPTKALSLYELLKQLLFIYGCPFPISLIDTWTSCYDLHLTSEGQMLKATSPAEATPHGKILHEWWDICWVSRYNGITNITYIAMIEKTQPCKWYRCLCKATHTILLR